MFELLVALALAAAPAPAPAAKSEPQKAPAADTHDQAKPEEKPMDEASKKIVKLADGFAAQTRSHIAAYEDLLASLKDLKDPKDCAATAKAVAAKAKKHEADQAKAQAATEELRKPLPQGDQNTAAGNALVKVTPELIIWGGYDSTIGAFKGKCPKQGDEVEKLLNAQRKYLSPP